MRKGLGDLVDCVHFLDAMKHGIILATGVKYDRRFCSIKIRAGRSRIAGITWIRSRLELAHYRKEAGALRAIEQRMDSTGETQVSRNAASKQWEYDDVLERVQKRLDDDPGKIPLRSKAVEHPFGTIKAWMGATHFKMKTLQHVATEMALHELAYNLKRVMAVFGVPKLLREI